MELKTLEIIVAISSAIISGIGVYFTWKTYRNTDSIKHNIKSAVHRDRLFAESVELTKRLQKCREKTFLMNIDLSQDNEFTFELRYICSRLFSFIESDNKVYSLLLHSSTQLNLLANDQGLVQTRNSAYSMVIADLEAIIKSGSVI